MTRGPLLSDDGERHVGSVYLFDVRDLDAARDLVHDLPYSKGGLYGDEVLHRWRFGRVFDRFKA